MAIILGLIRFLILGMLAMVSFVFLRMLIVAGVFAAFLTWVHLIIISGVGCIVFAALYEVLGASHIGWIWAGAIAAGLLVG